MQPTRHTGAMSRCILGLSLLLRVDALLTRSGNLPRNHTQIQRLAPVEEAAQSSNEAASASEAHHITVRHALKKLPVPTGLCFITCFQFVVVYTALFICRSYHELTSTAAGRLEPALRAAAQTLTYGPMLCVLFVACRMHVEYLSHGKEELKPWVQTLMLSLTGSVLVSTMLVLVIQLITGKPFQIPETPFDVERPPEKVITSTCKVAVYVLTALRYLVLLALFGGLVAVIFGTCTHAPATSKDVGVMEAPAPAIRCTMILALVFFTAQFVIAACRTFSEVTQMSFPQCVGVMHAAAVTVEFAPMLSMLFLAANMRAEQHGRQPEEWVHACMYASTGALCSTVISAMIVPLVVGGVVKRHLWTNQVFVEVPKPALGYMFIVLRYLCMCCFYGGAAGIMVSIFIFESPGPGATLPVSPAAQCVVNLTCQFFFVYFLATLMLTVSEMTGGTVPVERWSFFPPIEAARSTLAFAPMVSIIFITARMNILLVTENKGAPATWVQDGMYLTTWSLQMSGLMCLTTGLFMARAGVDYDGNIINKFSNWYIGVVVLAVRYTSMLAFYSGLVMVTIGLFTMAPGSSGGALGATLFRPS